LAQPRITARQRAIGRQPGEVFLRLDHERAQRRQLAVAQAPDIAIRILRFLPARIRQHDLADDRQDIAVGLGVDRQPSS
jgi:hypothetical protein